MQLDAEQYACAAGTLAVPGPAEFTRSVRLQTRAGATGLASTAGRDNHQRPHPTRSVALQGGATHIVGVCLVCYSAATNPHWGVGASSHEYP
jgi:hypothetical protein